MTIGYHPEMDGIDPNELCRDDLYSKLGFKRPEFLENPYGIRIYLGTKGRSDWCIVIPKALVKLKCSQYDHYQDYAMYFISEHEALSVAKMYTELAKKSKGDNV